MIGQNISVGAVAGLTLRGWFIVTNGAVVKYGGGVTSVNRVSAGNFTANIAQPDGNVILDFRSSTFLATTFQGANLNGATTTTCSIRCRNGGVDGDPGAGEFLYVGIYG